MADPVAASLRRLLRSDTLLGLGASRMQLTRTLLSDSYRLLARVHHAPGTVLLSKCPAVPSASDGVPAGATSAARIMSGWPHPVTRQIAAGRSLFQPGVLTPANDQPQPAAAPAKRAMTAADLACLAEAAILLDLPDAGERLTTAAYGMLDSESAAHTASATATLREALRLITCRNPADSL